VTGIDPNNPEWPLLAVAEAKWRCVKLDRPRVWEMGVDYVLITDTLDIIPRPIWVAVREHDTPPGRDHYTATEIAMRQSRQWVYNVIAEMLQTGRTDDGIRFRKVLPPALAVPYRNAQQTIRHANREFDKTMEVIGDGHGGLSTTSWTRWGLRHKPTGATIYFNVLRPLAQMTPGEKQRMVDQAMADLNRAVKERAGSKTAGTVPSPDPAPTVN
jgi:hypothetical protein